MKDKVLHTIQTNALLEQGDRVTVGLSGGADSVALLCVLLELREALGVEVSAAHVNHMLRGAESDKDEMFCRRLCEKLSVPLAVFPCDVPAYCRGHGVSAEEGARILRYEALSEAASGGRIATAHHIEDSIETVLLNLVRGTALDGLCGIPVKRDRIIRPLLFCSREEIEAYLGAKGLEYCTDSTNALGCAARNRLRAAVMPVLCGENPAFLQNAARMTRALGIDRDFLDREADRLWDEAFSDGGLLLKPYAAAHPALRLRVMRRLLREEKISYDAKRLKACDSIALAGKGSRPLSDDAVFCAENGRAKMMRRAESKTISVFDFSLEDLARERDFHLNDEKTLKIRVLSEQEIKFFVNCRPKEYKNSVDCDKMKKPAVIRGRRAGDALRPVGRGCTKTLKKWMNETGVEPSRRDALAVLADIEGPVWAENLGTAERTALTGETRRAFLLTITGEEANTWKRTSSAFCSQKKRSHKR